MAKNPVLNNIRIDKKFWINLVCFILGGILLIYLYSKYRIAPDIKFSELQLQTTSGETVNLSDYKGKVVFIDFWQTWCGTCIEEMPSIEYAKENMDSTKIVFLVVSDEDQNKIENFRSQKKYKIDFLISTKKLKELGINAFPTTYVINQEGKVVISKIGGVDWSLPVNLEQLKQITGE